MHPCCIIGLNMSLNTIKTTDVPLMKTLKATPSSIKLAFGAMCVILGIGPEKIPEAQSKKNVIIQKKKKKIQRNRTCNRNNYDNNFKYNLLSLYNFETKNWQFQFYETALKKIYIDTYNLNFTLSKYVDLLQHVGQWGSIIY